MQGLLIAAIVSGAAVALLRFRPHGIHGPQPGFERLPLEIPVHVLLDERELDLQSIDISRGGICLHMEGPAAVGQPVEMSFQLPGSERLSLYGVVRWHIRDKMGVLFDLQDERRAWVSAWIEAHQMPDSAKQNVV